MITSALSKVRATWNNHLECPLLRTSTDHRQCLYCLHRPLSRYFLQKPTHRLQFSSIPEVEDDVAFAEEGKTRLTPCCLTPATLPELQLHRTKRRDVHCGSSIDQNAETDPSFSSSSSLMTTTTTTITLTGLPPNTVKTDIRPVFQRFGEGQKNANLREHSFE